MYLFSIFLLSVSKVEQMKFQLMSGNGDILTIITMGSIKLLYLVTWTWKIGERERERESK